VAEVFKAFLHCSSRLIVHYGGAVTSYDGNRVMGIFLGDHPATNAVKCALNLNYARIHIINAAIKARYPKASFELKTVTGVDVGMIRGIRTGARGNNDLAWIGRAPNLAAKLSTLPSDYPTWITNTVFNRLPDKVKNNKDGLSMWEKRSWTAMDNMEIYRSSYWWDTQPTK
jgi:class 3 adenylate cyclase